MALLDNVRAEEVLRQAKRIAVAHYCIGCMRAEMDPACTPLVNQL